MERKPTLLELRRQHNITSSQLAKKANIPLYQSYTVEIGGFTHKVIAEKSSSSVFIFSQEAIHIIRYIRSRSLILRRIEMPRKLKENQLIEILRHFICVMLLYCYSSMCPTT